MTLLQTTLNQGCEKSEEPCGTETLDFILFTFLIQSYKNVPLNKAQIAELASVEQDQGRERI